jgi:4'-phosphopantetheinyl transferase
LDVSRSVRRSLRRTLAPDEQARARRFHRSEDEVHFVVARGVLRDILSRYAGGAPAKLKFRYSRFGKPALSTSPEIDQFRFNLSHSHGLAIYAVARDQDVGADVEWIQPQLAWEPLAERFFSKCEVTALRALPSRTQVQAFFQYWTGKEAYVKAQGSGLTISLKSFSVTLVEAGQAAENRGSDEPRTIAGYSLQNVEPAPRYAAALAVERGSALVRSWDWQYHKVIDWRQATDGSGLIRASERRAGLSSE